MPKKKLKSTPAGTRNISSQNKDKSSKGSGPDLLDVIDRWLEQNQSGFMVFLVVLSFMFSLLLFNVRISEGGDDSTYIEAGYNYSCDFFNYHFTYNAPLYPMMLSIPIKIFGINLRILKFTSVIFSILHIIFLYLAFRKRMPNVILFPVLFFVAVNSFFLYHASQTYNEAFFLFIQALFFYTSFRLLDRLDAETQTIPNLPHWLFFGFVAFIFTLSKNIAILGIGAMIVYFLMNKNFRGALFTVVSYLVFRIPYEIFSHFVWTKNSQYSSQFSVQLQKDAYHPEYGNEDLAGFFNRFVQNAELFFSRRLMHILNFKPETDVVLNHTVTIIVALVIIAGAILLFRAKNKYLLITGFYTIPMIAATFLLLQITWEQPRLILIYVPFLLFIAFHLIYYLVKNFRKIPLSLVYCGVVLMVVFLSLVPSVKKAKENMPVLRKNLHGDMVYGYTPDWVNFLKLSEWCGKHLPDSAYVASRKPSMSFIYSNGKKFHPVYTINSSNADTVLMDLKQNKVTHALLSNLRKDKSKPADSTNVINTVHRLLKPVVEKYPQSLKLVHKIGDKEPAYLLEIIYPESLAGKNSTETIVH